MGLLYAWATKEYLLERMSFGQIAMYLNYGLRMQYPEPASARPRTPNSMMGRSAEEIRRRRDELRRQFGMNIEGM